MGEIVIMNDMLHFAMLRACIIFGNQGDNLFNNVSLAQALSSISGVDAVLDGSLVKALLVGRDDVEVLSGGCHFRVLTRIA